MSVLIFKLTGVADDEANDVRHLLQANALDYYETTAGRWGIGVAALWLVNDAERDKARSLIAQYQHERLIDMRQRQQQDKLDGHTPSLWQHLKQQPFRVAAIVAAAILVLYLSIWPLIKLGA